MMDSDDESFREWGIGRRVYILLEIYGSRHLVCGPHLSMLYSTMTSMVVEYQTQSIRREYLLRSRFGAANRHVSEPSPPRLTESVLITCATIL